MSATAPAPVAARSRSRALPPVAIAVLQALAVIALILFLTRLAFLQARSFDGDLFNDAWYIQHQADALRSGHAPTLYLHSENAAFYPVFAFYGGTLFVVAAALSLLVGSAFVAEAVVYAAAFAAAYGGWLWLARTAGVRGWLAHAPGVVYVTAPYVLTNLYVRQDLVETVATAAMPLMVASALSVGRADRLRLGPAVALAASTIAFTGSHNLTLLWGTMFLVLLAAIVAAAVPSARGVISRRGALRILTVVAPATAVNAWFLLPDLVYSHDTAIAQRLDDARSRLRAPNGDLSIGHLLTPGRPDDGVGGGFTLPVLALAWALLVAATTFRARRGSPWLRLLVVLTACALAIAVLMSQAHILADLPSPFVLLQLGERLSTFALFGICGALIAASALAGRPAPWLAGLLAVVLAVGLAQAIVQVSHVERQPRTPFTPDGVLTYGLGDYADGTTKRYVSLGTEPSQALMHAMVHDDRGALTFTADPGDVVLTNVMAPTALVHVEGATVAGIWQRQTPFEGWQLLNYLALRIPEDAKGSRHTVVITAARPWPVVVGQAISILALLYLAAMTAVLTWRRWPRPPRPPAPRPRPRPGAAP